MDEDEYRLLSDVVAAAFVEAAPEYVERVAPGSIDRGDMEAVVLRMVADLDHWKTLTARTQRQTPLEIVRTALSDILAEDLLPATSRELGEGAWRVHVAWGIARAELVAGVVPSEPPRFSSQGVLVVIVSTNVMDRTRMADVVEQRGAVAIVWRNPGAVSTGLVYEVPDLALLDLEHAAAHEVLRMLVAAGVRTVAYGPHVDDHAMAAARALGADVVLPRSQFFRRLPSLVPEVV